mmetsp:Transcript_18921/g.42964  ORF Transcript_18921/g.42964 Transcript_18921/m.42964 type:complete len:228 (+) Transcript_18921:46-729(+)
MITEDDAKRLGKELTKQHPLVVFGMAKKSASKTIGSGFQISSTTVTAVRKNGCELRVTSCRGDQCDMKTPFFAFKAPLSLQSADDVLNDRVISDLRNDVCGPDPLWLVTDPLALLILVVCGLLGYGTYIGVDNTTDAIAQAPRLEGTISAIFGTPRIFSYLVCGSFWFSIIAHAFEATIAVYYSLKSLKLGFYSTGLWGIMIFLVGYPIFGRLQELLTIEQSHAKSK